MFTDPSTPNLADFYAYCLSQGVPLADLPSGTLTTVSITTSGTISAVSTSGSVQSGEILIGSSIPDATYLTSWNATSGTVSPAPAADISAASVDAYSVYVAWSLNYAIQVALTGPGIGAGLAGFAGQYVIAVYNLGLHHLLTVPENGDERQRLAEAKEAIQRHVSGAIDPGRPHDHPLDTAVLQVPLGLPLVAEPVLVG
ncbi:MAG: hypothetical protein B7X10_00100, partial [Burkholderiales bacterium 21-58-4]